MAHYLIEFRFQGKAKYEIKKLVHKVRKKFRLKSRRAIPHITLAGALYTNDEKRLIKDFRQLCIEHPLMKFKVEGFNTFEHNNIIYLDIKPSEELKDFRWNLARKLKRYCKLKPHDYKQDFLFHSTIAMKVSDSKFEKIKKYVKSQPKLNFDHVVVRMTLIKGQKILKEYDFFFRRLFNRKLAKDKEISTKTTKLLKAYFEDRFNPDAFRGTTLRVSRKTFFDRIKDFFLPPKKYITSDLHLDHEGIIDLCDRPFLDPKEMNNTLVNNWNRTVRDKDTVYHIGDLTWKREYKTNKKLHKEMFSYWLNKLNGKINLIGGNHDPKGIGIPDHEILQYKGYDFYLTHKPDDIPKYWKGWSICGHHHNNHPYEYPLIDKKNKIINACTELTRYRPISMDKIIEEIKKN